MTPEQKRIIQDKYRTHSDKELSRLLRLDKVSIRAVLEDLGLTRDALSAQKPVSIQFHLVAILFVIFSILIGYGHTIHYAFHFDDLKSFVDTPGNHIKELTWSNISPILHANRPVANLTFALNFYFDRLETRGYHILNILIHIGSTLVIYFLFLQTLSLPGWGKGGPLGVESDEVGTLQPEKIALIGALLWGVHPVQTQAVTYVVQRMASLAALFYLAALLFYVYGRLTFGTKALFWYGLSALSAILAFGTKENSLTLPVVIFLYDLFFISRFNIHFSRKQVYVFIGILAGAIIGSGYIIQTYIGTNSFVGMLLANYGTEEMDSFLRVMSEWRVVVFYLSLLILPLPSRMNLDPDFPFSNGLFNPATTFFSFCLLLALFAFSILKSRKYPLISYAILWFFINLAMESTFIKLDLVFEHRLYLPSVMLFLLVPLAGYRLANRFRIQKEVVIFSIAVLLAAVLLFMTHERNKVWKTSVSLWSDVESKSPNKSRVKNNLGKAYLEEERWDQARDKFIESIKLDPKNQEALNNLGNAYQREAKYDLAIKYYEEVLRLNNNNPLAHNDLGVAYQNTGKSDLAIREFLEAVRLDPYYTDARNNLGNIYLITNQLDLAIVQYQKTIDLNPKHMMAHTNLGILYQKQGKMKESLEEFKIGLSLNPHSSIAQFNYAYMMDMMGQKNEAIAHYEEAIKWAAPQDAGQIEVVKRRLKEIKG
ncbi:MAG: tetratricopeptide repeat protein [Nitrospirae bacterium]|nr:tetratricopeptide repeat protein [Nitrospirota bacterium]MBI3594514.1 tetratricopeptide repeat protein [Nitrospirota bacterium]